MTGCHLGLLPHHCGAGGGDLAHLNSSADGVGVDIDDNEGNGNDDDDNENEDKNDDDNADEDNNDDDTEDNDDDAHRYLNSSRRARRRRKHVHSDFMLVLSNTAKYVNIKWPLW